MCEDTLCRNGDFMKVYVITKLSKDEIFKKLKALISKKVYRGSGK